MPSRPCRRAEPRPTCDTACPCLALAVPRYDSLATPSTNSLLSQLSFFFHANKCTSNLNLTIDEHGSLYNLKSNKLLSCCIGRLPFDFKVKTAKYQILFMWKFEPHNFFKKKKKKTMRKKTIQLAPAMSHFSRFIL